jgi:signal transduction histidine kinase
LNSRQVKYTNNILTSGRQLLQLINDILDLAKVESGHADLVRETFDVTEALAEVRTIVKSMADQKQISLEFWEAPDVPALFACEAKFKQILYNLLGNAIKFTPNGGKVFVTTDRQFGTIGEFTPAEDCLRVAVSDTGIGINVQDQKRIFNEFEQVDSSYGRQQQGTGLGLALARNLVEMHGGRIWVASEGVAGKGSSFTFLIPIPNREATMEAQNHITPGSSNDFMTARADNPLATGVSL